VRIAFWTASAAVLAIALAACTTVPPGTVAPGSAWFALDGDAASGLNAYALTVGAGDPFSVYITYGASGGGSAHQLQVTLQPGVVGPFVIGTPAVHPLQVRFKNWRGTYDCDVGVAGSFYIKQYSATVGDEIVGDVTGEIECTLTSPTGVTSPVTPMLTGRFSATVQ
jgi:hypothetical protein